MVSGTKIRSKQSTNAWFLNQSLDDGTSEGNPIYDEIIVATSGHTVDIEATSYLTALAESGYATAGMIVSYTFGPTTLSFKFLSLLQQVMEA